MMRGAISGCALIVGMIGGSILAIVVIGLIIGIMNANGTTGH